MSALASERWPEQIKCSQVAQCATYQQAPVYVSKALERNTLKGFLKTPKSLESLTDRRSAVEL
jgi:hypothetical protein